MPTIMLEANVGSRKRAEFEKDYARHTGRGPSEGDYYSVYKGKWGVEGRIYFDSEALRQVLEALGYHVERVRPNSRWGSYRYRVNNNELFWNLVGHGLRLGPNR